MSLIRIVMDRSAQVGIKPRYGSMESTDDYLTIITPGYLNTQPNSMYQNFYPSDIICASYSDGDNGEFVNFFTLSFSSTKQITLVKYIESVVENITTVSTTPASGTCAAQFQLVDNNGLDIEYIYPIQFYLSSSVGTLGAAITGVAALTNGSLVQLVTGRVIIGTTNATGQIGVTITASAGTYYLSFILPNGRLVTSFALVVN